MLREWSMKFQNCRFSLTDEFVNFCHKVREAIRRMLITHSSILNLLSLIGVDYILHIIELSQCDIILHTEYTVIILHSPIMSTDIDPQGQITYLQRRNIQKIRTCYCTKYFPCKTVTYFMYKQETESIKALDMSQI